MTGKAVWHRLAEEDLTEAFLHIGARSPAAAKRLLDAVEHAITLLLANPRAGRVRVFRSPLARGIRSWPVKGFEDHLIFYRECPDGIEIVRFIHGARDIPSLIDDQT